MITIVKNYIRKKETKYYLIILSLFMFIFLLFINLYFNTDNKIKLEEDYYMNRELSLITEDNIDIIKNKTSSINSIKAIYRNDYISAKLNNKQISISTFIKEKEISIIKGTNPSSNNEIMLSSSYLDLCDKTINVIINEQEYIMKVVGIYEDKKEDIGYVYDHTIYESEFISSYLILIDHYQNANKTILELQSISYETNLYNSSFIPYNLMLTRNVLFVFTIIILICIILFHFTLFKNMFLDNKRELFLLKAFGYKDLSILKIDCIKNIYLTVVCILIALLVYIVLPIYFSINSLLYLVLIEVINIIINILSLVFSLKRNKKIIL